MTPFSIAMAIVAAISLVSLVLVVVFFSDRLKKGGFADAEEARRLVNSIASSYNIAYVVNMATDVYKQLRMDDFIVGKGKEFDNFTQAKEYFFSLLPESDKERMQKELDYNNIRIKLKEQRSYSVEYRALIGGATIWHEMIISYIDDDNVAIGFAVKDLEITKRHLEDKRYSEYFALYEVDIDSEMVKIVIESPYYSFGKAGDAFPYAAAMRKFATTLDGEAADYYNRFADIEYVKKVFATDDKQTYTYKSNNVREKNWVDLTSFVTLRHEDGTPAMFSLGFSWIDSFGAARQELQSRIAEQKDLLEKQQEQLQKALSDAETANSAKSEFLFNMSHDIRTPMNAILGYTNMAENHIEDKEKVLDCLEKTQISGRLLLTLINSVLDMSRIESGSAECEEQAGDVYFSFSNIETTLMQEAKEKGVDLSFEFGSITDRYVYADFTRCLRIFTNLISNSIKYTKTGGSVRVKCEQAGPAHNDVVKFRYTFEDTGIGMSEEFQKHMFEAFTREHNSTISGIQGTGLGLSVCKTFVDYLHGTITCESKPNEGTKFTVELPFKIQKGHEYTDPVTGEVRESGETEPSKEVDLTGRRVLIAEDNEMNREIVAGLLSDRGLLVEEAENGVEAVYLMQKKGPEYFDFVLMDIQMPVMNGYDATKRIREMYPNANIPIIAVSANAFEEDRKASQEANMNGHVAKPIDVNELFMMLARFA